MAKNRPKDDWRKERRVGYLETRKYRYYIFCEGTQTEPKYFNAIKRYIEQNPVYKDMVLIEIEPCGEGTVKVLQAAENYIARNKIKSGQVWCVYDKDDFPDKGFNAVPERMLMLNSMNDRLQYRAAWSNQSVELWFVLHFAYYASDNHRSEYIDFLIKKFQELGVGSYQKNMSNVFDILTDKGNPVLAQKYAERLLSNAKGKAPADVKPGTTVHYLVRELACYLPDGIRNIYL